MRSRFSVPIALTVAALALSACVKDAPSDASPGTPDPKAGGTGGIPADPAREPAAAPRADGAWEKTGSGLEYQVLTAGVGGRSPKRGDQVTVSYKGWLEGGKVFDESARHGGPQTFGVGDLVEGWNEALQRMTVGAKWRLRIPGNLGYGDRGSPPDIPPNATLYFELELHHVTPGHEPPKPPELVKPDPAKSKVTAKGLRYETVKEGIGDLLAPGEAAELRIALYNEAGKFLNQQNVVCKPSELRIEFLREAPFLMRAGSHLRCEVPPALAFGAQAQGPDIPANSTTYWEIELVRIIKPLPLPPFELPEEASMERRRSGLLMKTDRQGDGESPRIGDTVTVHYAGWLTDGTLFDSSFARGEPAKFQVGRVIEGWNEGLQNMKPGQVCRLVIPAKLAYGEQAVGDKIKPGATLVFLVELISVEKARTQR